MAEVTTPLTRWTLWNEALGVTLPDDIRWLLGTYGYWHATGISSLDETVADTQAAREHLNLPHQFIVLYNHQDGGAILLDTVPDQDGENKVYNVGWEAIPDQIDERSSTNRTWTTFKASLMPRGVSLRTGT